MNGQYILNQTFRGQFKITCFSIASGCLAIKLQAKLNVTKQRHVTPLLTGK